MTGVLIVIIISVTENDIFLLIFDSDKYAKFSVGVVWFGLLNALPADGFWSALAHFDGIKTIDMN